MAAVKVNPSGDEVKAKTEPWLNQKMAKAKGKASVIPAKRRLVKRMMLDFFVQFVSSLCSSAASSKSKQK